MRRRRRRTGGEILVNARWSRLWSLPQPHSWAAGTVCACASQKNHGANTSIRISLLTTCFSFSFPEPGLLVNFPIKRVPPFLANPHLVISHSSCSKSSAPPIRHLPRRASWHCVGWLLDGHWILNRNYVAYAYVYHKKKLKFILFSRLVSIVMNKIVSVLHLLSDSLLYLYMKNG